MKPDEYGADIGRIIADIRRDLDNLTAQVTRVTGTPVTQASSAFLIPQTSTPGAPSGAAYLYYDGSTLRARTPSIDYSTLAPDPPVASRTDIAANMAAGSAPGSYSQSYLQNLRDDVVEVRRAVNEQINNLRASGQSA